MQPENKAVGSIFWYHDPTVRRRGGSIVDQVSFSVVPVNCAHWSRSCLDAPNGSWDKRYRVCPVWHISRTVTLVFSFLHELHTTSFCSIDRMYRFCTILIAGNVRPIVTRHKVGREVTLTKTVLTNGLPAVPETALSAVFVYTSCTTPSAGGSEDDTVPTYNQPTPQCLTQGAISFRPKR